MSVFIHRHKLAPTILGEFSGADEGGDGETVPGAYRQASPAPRHAAGAAVQPCPLVGVAEMVTGRRQGQVGVHVFHAFAVTLTRHVRFYVSHT